MSTICAPATAAGGAIGVVRLSGSQSIDIINKVFSKDLTSAEGYTLHYGTISSTAEKNAADNAIDDVMVSVYRAPHSYTGEDAIEISCHGSRYIIHEICKALCSAGAVLAEPGEFTKRAFLNGKMDLSQAEAVADLISSSNKSQHYIAFSQMRGGVSSKLAELREQLLTMTSLLELELDFSEEDVEFADRERLLNLSQEIEKEIKRLINSFSTGNALKNGIPVAIVGAPNVGKSTLLNQLLKDDKAIVSDVAGTTRDLIEDTITLDGILFRFIDTAGIRHTEDKVEKIGIKRSVRAAEKARIIIMMTEPGVDYPKVQTAADQQVIKVCNKTDEFQAINGQGIEQLERQLVDAVGMPEETDVMISSLRHKEALTEALKYIEVAHQSLSTGTTQDIVALDLNACINSLSEILGKAAITSEATLENIFKNFCIGK